MGPEGQTRAALVLLNMRVEMDLTLELAQKQVITQQMIQSMEILQLNAIELQAYIENLSMENPVVDLVEAQQAPADVREQERARKLEWLESTDRQNRVYYQEDRDENAENNWRDINESGESLSDYLESQLLLTEYTDTEREILDYIIYSLDSKGYFGDDTAEAAKYFGISEEEFLEYLSEIQELDPAGIAARDLRECLLLQLYRQKDYSPVTEAVIKDHLNDIARNHLQLIAKKLQVSIQEVTDACEEIRSMNPIPGNSFSDRNQLRYISPDAVVVKLENEFEILVNEYQYPQFTINSYYQNLAKTTDDPEAKKYLKEKIAQAEAVAASIVQRSSTLSRVMHVLVERQEDFFMYGPGHKRPLRLADIAQALDLHESTISRTLHSKYLQCTWGVFPLNYFLTSAAAVSEETGEAQTAEYIKEQIQKIVDEEDKKKPLSDDGISKKLQEMDIRISRRTVNKYRTSMGIPDKSGRKEWTE